MAAPPARPLILGHRGAPAEAPENTLASFRRAAELGADEGAVLAEQTLRDARDSTRAHSPLRPADGSITLDTTGMSVAEVVARVATLAREAEAQS